MLTASLTGRISESGPELIKFTYVYEQESMAEFQLLKDLQRFFIQINFSNKRFPDIVIIYDDIR